MNQKIETIFLDLDDVIVDFYGAALKLFPYHNVTDMSNWSVEESLGITHEEFWARIVREPRFWEELPWLPWGLTLHKELTKIAPVVFATSPSSCPYAAAGKIEWFHKYFGRDFRKFVLVQDKEVLARHNTLLIDDRDYNVDKFIEAGGYAIAFPRPWNKNRHTSLVRDPAAVTLLGVEEIQYHISLKGT
jgi:5'(3')-deoxyribonucleotidase